MTYQPHNERTGTAPLCPNCGNEVEPGGRGLGRIFCQAKCRLEFNARMKARGAVLAPYIQAQTQTRHAKAGSTAAAVCAYARSEITQIGAIFNDEDREAGRPPASAYVEAMMRSGTRYIDRRR